MKWFVVACACLGLVAGGALLSAQTLESYGDIVIDGSWERVASDARNPAFAEEEPELEFEAVRAFIKDRVDAQRITTGQQVRFSNPDKFKTWLVNVSRRVGRSRDELVDEIVESIAPNRCPELTGEDSESSDYYRNRARDAIRERSGQAANEPDDVFADVEESRVPSSRARRSGRSTPRPPSSPATGDPSLIRIEDVDVRTTRSKATPDIRSPGKPKTALRQKTR